MASVRLRDIGKAYEARNRRVHALSGVNLDIADGALVALVGPSGSGKTTALRIVAGLERPTSGTLYIGDQDMRDLPPQRRDVAMVFQDHALYPHMTARGNMAFGLRSRRMPRAQIDARVREASAVLGIESLLDRKPVALSGGQRQRVALGRAMVRRPRVFLFDEPLSNLDATLRLQMRSEIKDLHATLAATMLYVTHDQEEAMTLGQHLVILHEGRIQQQGAPLAIYDRPANRFVAGFVGTPPMNFFDAHAHIDGDKIQLRGPGFAFAAPVSLHVLHVCDTQSVVVGIRPGDVYPAGVHGVAGGRSVITATVRRIEFLGDAIDVHAALPSGQSLISRIQSAEGVVPGRELQFAVDPNRIHLFANDDVGARLD